MVEAVLSDNIEIKKYGRFWAVYVDSELLAVVVYKKGAKSIQKLLERLIRRAAHNA